jgi:glycine/D-amino acid oxidase-like deaminating enzyme
MLDYDVIVIGGGFFGCSLALHLYRKYKLKVVILERDSDLLQRASFVNQARVHNGYHYPRSILTALRSRVNFPRFVSDYTDCVADGFDAYYAVAQGFSNVTAAQFRLFCERIGAPIHRAPKDVRALFDSDKIEDVFRVTEYAFDAEKLKQKSVGMLEEDGIEVRFSTEASRVQAMASGGLEVSCKSPGGPAYRLSGGRVYNCTYSRINKLLSESGLPRIPLKHELTEVALVKVPEVLEQMAITVMCGPFFSVMPFPARGLHSLTHVRYTPHREWHDDGDGYTDGYAYLNNFDKKSNYQRMVKDAQRYIPCLAETSHVDSLWEVKTVLPVSEFDDSRPILFMQDHGLKNLTCIMGGKIDNIYDMIDFEAGLSSAG